MSPSSTIPKPGPSHDDKTSYIPIHPIYRHNIKNHLQSNAVYLSIRKTEIHDHGTTGGEPRAWRGRDQKYVHSLEGQCMMTMVLWCEDAEREPRRQRERA